MFKRLLSCLLGVVILTSTISVSAKAAELDAVSTAGTVAAATAFGLEEAYTMSVVSRMAGRCGAATPTGAKGIAFEIMYTDLSNIKNALNAMNRGLKTQFTKCPNAETIDLITLDNAGKVVERIQCKNTPSTTATDEVIRAVQSGKYRSSQLVGTTESAEAFNAKAAAKGISKVMKDSGISTKATEHVADIALGKITPAMKMIKETTRSSAVGAMFSGGIAALESTINGDDVYDATGNIVTETVEGGVEFGVGTMVACTAEEALNAVAVTGGTLTLSKVVICVGTTLIVAYILDGVAEKLQVKELISKYTKMACEKGKECLEDVKIFVADLELQDKAVTAKNAVAETSSKVAESTKRTSKKAWKATKSFASKTYEKAADGIEKIKEKRQQDKELACTE